MEIGRNQPCPCSSRRKYKRCHGDLARGPSQAPVARLLAKHKADEFIREQQQGLGKPIISAKLRDHQFVAVGNRVFFSKGWKTFADFLKTILDPAWGNTKLAKPLNERHIILQWYNEYCRYQKETIITPGVVHSSEIVGVVACYLGLAYSLYLLAHNVELQNRLISRLKNPGNFQRAYYELMVANALIRAGFVLTLEDETDGNSRHCEYAAASKHTGKKYSVEAKMRAAADQRLIFIDLNTDLPADTSHDKEPEFIERAIKRLTRYENEELEQGKTAYVFVTSLPFHRALRASPTALVAPFGLGIADFNKAGAFSLGERYRQEQKHLDALRIGEAFSKYLVFPTTFDGSLPSETITGKQSRVVIGQTYFFEDVGEGGTVATVTTGSVNETEKVAYIGTSTGQILSMPMTDEELADYRHHSSAYFGEVRPEQKLRNTPYELFEWFVETHKNYPRDYFLKQLAAVPNFEVPKALSDDDLRLHYCEAAVSTIWAMRDKKKGAV